jgi:hypothetical protein
MTHSTSLKSHKFILSSEKSTTSSIVPTTSSEFNFGANINQWKKYPEVDEFVSLFDLELNQNKKICKSNLPKKKKKYLFSGGCKT